MDGHWRASSSGPGRGTSARWPSLRVFVVLLILCYHLWYVGLPLSGLTTPMGLEHMFPIMTYYTLTVMLFPLLLLLSRVFRVWRLTMGERNGHPSHSLSMSKRRGRTCTNR